MRKGLIKMMVVAGAAALIIPTAAMAEWDQSETHNNQEDHDAMINVFTAVHPLGDFAYNMESTIGYDQKGDGSAAILATNNPWKKTAQAPWNTTPCPIQLADPTAPFMWEDAMGNCPAQVQPTGWTIGQTNMGWGEGDNEAYGPILDDLYQSLSEFATTDSNENGDKAFKKVDQVLDILFYKGNTVGEVYGADGWVAQDGTHWFGGFGLDQTLDQDVADVSGTTGNALGAPHGTWLWNYDHVAQTFYQDFRLWDKNGNTSGVGDVDGDGAIEYTGGATPGDDYVDFATASKYLRGQHNPRTRHGIEILAVASGVGGTYDTDGGGYGWGVITLDAEDFGFFDQWVIQSMRDTYDIVGYDGNGTAAPVTSFTSTVALNQSYSSWMAVGVPGQLCDSVNDNPTGNNECVYVYEKDGHSVNKSITPTLSNHQTGDP